jgi:hypothetical protein
MSKRSSQGSRGRIPTRSSRRPPWEKRGPGAGVLVAGSLVAALLLAAAGWFLFGRSGNEEAAPTPVETATVTLTPTPMPTATQTATPTLSPTPTLTATPTWTLSPTVTLTPTATETPVPVVCITVQEVWVRNQPRDESIGLALVPANAVVQVFGIVPSETGAWYELAGYPERAFAPVAAVNCP